MTVDGKTGRGTKLSGGSLYRFVACRFAIDLEDGVTTLEFAIGRRSKQCGVDAVSFNIPKSKTACLLRGVGFVLLCGNGKAPSVRRGDFQRIHK